MPQHSTALARDQSSRISSLCSGSATPSANLREKKPGDFPQASCLDHFSAKKAMWLFIRRLTDLDEKEREELATIRQASETAESLYLLVQQFLQIVRKLEGERLEAWCASVMESGIEDLQRFANGLEQDKPLFLWG